MKKTWADNHNKLFDELVRVAKVALFKLDIEFHRVPGVAQLEGWQEANNLRDVLERIVESDRTRFGID